jgi:membrane carboxypeptidase/penicillin-binding protein PbpC
VDLRANRSIHSVTPAFCQHVLQQKRDASFRWHDGVKWEVISTDRPPL